jgi:phenylacetate-CoA ligase
LSLALRMTAVEPAIELRLLTELRRAADQVDAYRTLLAESGVRVEEIDDLESFARLCPLLNKRNTFGRFRLTQLSAGDQLHEAAEVLTSSGHGGRFSFGVISRQEAADGAASIDAAMDAAFDISSRSTLAINCLPMGVVFSSTRMTVGTTSVREDMVVALMEAVGDCYDQVILVGDPLFMKRLTDYAAEVGCDWRRYRINVVLGEEIFGEHFRDYLAAHLGLDPERPQDGYVMSSFGVGELGLHLCFETPATIAVRRAALANPALGDDLLGSVGGGQTLPMIFTFNPERAFIEVVRPDRHGYGEMTISMLDSQRLIPLLRYQPGDVVRMLDREQLIATFARHGVAVPDDLPASLLALRGREKEALPDGSHVGFYKNVLYADRQVATRVTGAFRLILSAGCCHMHVQLVRGQAPHADLEQRLLRALAVYASPTQVVLWPYASFPYGMTTDYERKFSHYVPGELEAANGQA